ncbi:DUF924 family protein [Pararhizobium haloflavum]|uniref:DUF924 family protein n=1 Tax=Pararhizobium haloflavum TaxID=2037914 RepID=UPI000C1808B6|nr:DUF924 family protein [Pararhizobium haloflavum]
MTITSLAPGDNGDDGAPERETIALATPQDVLAFWFEELTPEDWFMKKDATDEAIRQRFAATHLHLAKSVLPAWRETAEARLALIIVLDQFPRNIYRDTPLAFATDGLALREARAVVREGHDKAIDAERRVFFYMPFEHAENLADQKRSVDLISALGNETYTDYAERHRDVIAKYGRFPHRNAILGRTSTLAEERYLAEPGSGF